MDADLTLGVALTPTAVAVVLRRGPRADGAVLDYDLVDVAPGPAGRDLREAPRRTVDAVLRTHAMATRHGYRILGVGVVCLAADTSGTEIVETLTRAGLRNVVAVAPAVQRDSAPADDLPARSAGDAPRAALDAAALAAQACSSTASDQPHPHLGTDHAAAPDHHGHRRHHRVATPRRTRWWDISRPRVLIATVAIGLSIVTAAVGVEVTADDQTPAPISPSSPSPGTTGTRPARSPIARTAPRSTTAPAPVSITAEPAPSAEPTPAPSLTEPPATASVSVSATSRPPDSPRPPALDEPPPPGDPNPPPAQNVPPQQPETTPAPPAVPHLPADQPTPPPPGPT